MFVRLSLVALAASAAALTFTASPATAGDHDCNDSRGGHCDPPVVVPQTFNVIVGGMRADVLQGTDDADAIFGLGGNDRLVGKDGNDLLFGGRGNDRIFAGEGTDTVRGGTGTDTCVGDVDDRFIRCEVVIVL